MKKMRQKMMAVLVAVLTTAVLAIDETTPAFNWDGESEEGLFQMYSDLVKKTILRHPDCPKATITLKTRPGQTLSKEEQIEAIEVVLEMHGIHLEPYGDNFIRAIPRKDARKEGIPLIMNTETKLGDTGRVVSMMIPFHNIAIDEAQKALEGLKSNSGLLLVFERTNSILVTDTEQNINRMLQIANSLDQPTEVLENVFVRQIKYASAEEIKTALEAIVQDSQKELEKNGKQVNQNQAQAQNQNRLSGFMHRTGPNAKQPAAPVNNESLVTSVSDADRGMIRGKTLILSDQRSNKLIIVTMKTNMDFFDKVIEQLDVETTPDIVVKVYRLKYADSEDVSDMINDLIGNASSSKNSGKSNQNAAAKTGSGANLSRTAAAAKKPANQRTGESKPGELSKDNTTVLSDKRINGLVVMTQKDLVPVVESIIDAMDVKLSQVMIETCIIEVGLGHNIKTGMDWVKGMHKNVNDQYQSAIGGGGGDATAVSVATNAGQALLDATTTTLPSIFSPGGAGLNYAIFSKSLDLAAVISLSQSDSTSKYVASPVVMTVDNKEATIEATTARKFLSNYQTSSSYYGSTPAPQYESKDIGIKIKVTPKINPNGTVMLEVEEEYSQVGPKQTILDPNSKDVSIDTSLTRKMSADVLLDNQQTVVLGGLTDTLTETADAGIPILKEIPVIGKYLFGRTENSETRSELLVFLTPYVVKDGDEAEAEALRRKQALSDRRPWEDHGWSKSKLADPVSKKEQLRRLREEWKKQDGEHKAQIEIEQEKLKRVKTLEKMSVEERDAWLKLIKDDLDEAAQVDLEDKQDSETPESKEELQKLAEQVRKEKLSEAEAKLSEAETKLKEAEEKQKQEQE